MKLYTHYREPFLGGGSVAIEMTKRYPHLNIWVNDLYEPLFNFWIQLKDDNEALYQSILYTKIISFDKEKELFKESKQIINDNSCTPLERAAAFYLVNKCSFSGLTEAGGFSAYASKTRFTVSSIEKLRLYKSLISKWTITNLSYENLLNNSSITTFAYLDPPYDIDANLYGKRGNHHKGFDHEEFANFCNMLPMSLAISYNDGDDVKVRFPDWKHVVFGHNYSMITDKDSYRKDQRNRNELLLLNYKAPS